MYPQTKAAFSALLILLSSTTIADEMMTSDMMPNEMMKPICQKSSPLAIAKHIAPDCSMAKCSAEGKLVFGGTPEKCQQLCECPPPEKKMTDAPAVENNPENVTYTAILPISEKSTIRGSVSGTSSEDGMGVDFTISLEGLPDAGMGPFSYHIHDKSVPKGGDCTATGAHLDPYIRGQMPACVSEQPQTCEVGDLSGKHGQIKGQKFHATYSDRYLSTAENTRSFFGNRSVVIHAKNSTRLTCANFILGEPMVMGMDS